MEILERWSDEDWDGFLATCREATFFHSRVWARIVTESFPHCSDRSLWLKAGGEPLLLPLFAWRRAGGLLTTLHSSFPFLYGGPIPGIDAAGRRRDPELLEELARGSVSLRVAGNPFRHLANGSEGGGAIRAGGGNGDADGDGRIGGLAGERGRRAAAGAFLAAMPDRYPRGVRTVESHTRVLRLPGSEEEYWSEHLSCRQRNDVRRLGRKGVAVVETRSEEGAEQMHALYRRSFARWGGPPAFIHPRTFYLNLLRFGGDAVRLTLAHHDGRILGGTFTIRWNGIVHYLAGYFDRDSRALRPMVLLQIESIRRAIADGYRWYDLLPSGGHRSVERFKEGFGGARATFPIFERSGWGHRWKSRMRSLVHGTESG